MGGSESTGRRVSFGLDEEDRVRVLRGVRLSDDIVNRMKESALQRDKHDKAARTTSSAQTFPPRGQSTSEDIGGSKQPTYAEDELYRRYEKEQAIVQEELARIAKRERETAQELYSSAILREKNYTNQERVRTEQLPADLDEWAKKLQCKEEELKKLDAFHKEQLASIEKKNLEIYKLTAEQFHTAATNAEYRVKKRSYDPVCMNLQSNILKCYTANRQELLNCSDLAKEYRACVREAQKSEKTFMYALPVSVQLLPPPAVISETNRRKHADFPCLSERKPKE
ncbi:MICOS complex subunit MIC25 isoform X3 [Hyla sarda]|uniref:MICOS complex subunit MIC25 isoform X3 n=1 Tax=Hyla sarda TaxID=327740 RepID=UPI0024C2864D|nr:MICOS complex subunit MIC25 isoform X3 [Hyla sarda]